MDQNALQQIIDRLKEANNVLVTVSANPSVDQLSACIGLTLMLNHLGKHGTAVFSGAIPSTIEFLKPDDTLEKNTDSLRDFIIALDKSKADKLRYKVEDKVVKIFITPYRTSLSDKDLEFSQGDFNVDAVMALGVHERAELDKAIMDHGRILHDATVISVNNKDQGNLGAVNWVNLNASSLSEMMVELVHGLTTDPLDAQMATALMTGIVAETARFSNTKTSPRTMALASELMAAGANQQLIASKLEAAQPIPPAGVAPAADIKGAEDAAASADGSLQISHEAPAAPVTPATPAMPTADKPDNGLDDLPTPVTSTEPPIIPPLPAQEPPQPAAGMPIRSSMALEPPTMGGQLTANSLPEDQQADVSIDPLSMPAVDDAGGETPLLNRGTPGASMPAGAVVGDETLNKIEEDVDSPHLAAEAPETVEEARQAVDSAIAAEAPTPQSLDPIASLGAQPVDLNLRGEASPAASVPPSPLQSPEAIAPPPATDAPDLTGVNPPIDMPSTLPPAMPPQPLTSPTSPTPQPASPFGAPPDMNGVNPNLPTNLLPPSQPFDATAAPGNPAPPPVPPPLPPSDAF